MNGFTLALLAMFFWGLAALFDKMGLKGASPELGLTIRTVPIAVFVLTMFFVSGQTKQLATVKPSGVIFLALSGICAGVVGQLLYFKALKPGHASVVVPLVGAYPLITMILAIVLLKDKLTLVKSLGALLVVSGVFLLKSQR